MSSPQRLPFIRKRGLSKGKTDTELAEEGSPSRSVLDFVQGITAVARTKTYQDARLNLETRVKRLLDRVTS